MNDNDIIKALKICTNAKERCEDCPLYVLEGCTEKAIKAAIDLIGRQKAEIEHYAEEANGYQRLLYEAEEKARADKSEAIKEFAEKLKATFPARDDPRCSLDDCYTLDFIDRLAKEMTEGEN